jgi:uncharacterized protein YyaL (SSP411 family)
MGFSVPNMRKRTIALFLLIFSLLDRPVVAADFRFSQKPNTAHLIQWRTWGAEALREARRANKLILLSLSAVWCHWCHVMDETTYSDEEVRRLLNERFIAIRVDVDMRPDIDTLYNQGGWPSTVILTPAGEVIDGGNYVSPAELKARLARAAGLSVQERERIELRKGEARRRRAALRSMVTMAPDRDALESIAATLKETYDEHYGGFGSGQKFPNPEAMDFLLTLSVISKDRQAGKIVMTTLDRMARGGLYDQGEGGFFRYATRPDWSEPHYEKMLEVNAGLIRSYALASMVLGKKRFRRVMDESIGYVRRNLADANTGAFFGSQNADESYYQKQDRSGTMRPFVDRTSYADSASLMISALVAAYEATGEERYRVTATKAAEFLLETMDSPEEGIAHYFQEGTAALRGMLNDNALFGSALLDLAAITGERKYLDRAGRLGRTLIDRFYEKETRRFRSSLVETGVGPADEGALTSAGANLANYRAVRFLARLYHTGREDTVREVVDAVLQGLTGTSRTFTPYAPAYGNAALARIIDPVEITVVAGGARAQRYLAGLTEIYAPNKVVRMLSPTQDAETIRKLQYELGEAVYFCSGKRCSKPVRDPAKVRGELKRFLKEPTGR